LFTNTDNPHAASQHKQHQARSKAADLGQVDIDVELLHMGNNFDPSLFYKVREDISLKFPMLVALFKYKIGQKIYPLIQTL
jgi:hypothetical protein